MPYVLVSVVTLGYRGSHRLKQVNINPRSLRRSVLELSRRASTSAVQINLKDLSQPLCTPGRLSAHIPKP